MLSIIRKMAFAIVDRQPAVSATQTLLSLDHLDDRLLEDIGLTREQAYRPPAWWDADSIGKT